MGYQLGGILFLHIPRTAGIWTRNALWQAAKVKGLPFQKIEPIHGIPDDLSSYRTVFTYERDPLEWLRSVWVYLTSYRWVMQPEANQEWQYLNSVFEPYPHTDFHEFAMAFITLHPFSIAAYFERYYLPAVTRVKFEAKDTYLRWLLGVDISRVEPVNTGLEKLGQQLPPIKSELREYYEKSVACKVT